ncbi:MAG: tol-pal system protein YbgF [Burkholderiales bacterium]|nr:tol-pal system protein YbgF [Burkholderiales bacterium]
MRQSFIKASKGRQGGVLTRANIALALLGALGVLACNPSAAGLFSDDEARQALNEQSKQLVKLQNEKQALEARVLKLEETLRNQGLLDLLTQIDALNAEIGNLRGQSEVHGNNIDAAQKRQKDFYVDLDSRLRRLEQAAGGGSSAREPAPTPDSDSPAPEGDSPADSSSGTSGAGGKANSGAAVADGGRSASSSATEQKRSGSSPAPTAASRSSDAAKANPGTMSEASVYDTAYYQFKRGDYAGAVSGFQNFLRVHPNSPLAPNAQYWIGNAQFAQRDFAGAIASQKKLLANYPSSQKAADAMLNIANAQSEMGDAAAAKTTLQDVIGRYPSSEAGAKAKRRLSSLK